MKKFIAICLVCLFCGCAAVAFVGCASLKSEEQKVVAAVEKIDWTAMGEWYDKAVGGLDQAANVAKIFLPQDTAEIDVADKCIDATRSSVDTLTTLAAQAKAGTAKVTDVQASALQVKSDYEAAATAVGALLAKGKTSALPANPPAAK
jgi:hypothetical protein